ncbi:DUF4184 family protein [Paenibacillus sp. YN15]|uniref:DUF4184 family protein n=1 Tax=Paenibacillus sp. YN15 TaxID=1742774 RepID=UPI000DCB9EA1|nr:DUF4184 family protein [Paenibacillus sp. YN15]RAV04969.1 DUF4184 domain-containing protein [Paenibacillus sp. YN15]
MPFTFSHPIYALPLKYISPKKLNVTGLVLGSMAPDFEYFIMLEPYSRIGHSILGLIAQALPLSILLAFIFHRVVKEQMAIHLPSMFSLNRRAYHAIREWKLYSTNDWIIFLLSITVGFFSHIALDAFTHNQGYFVIHLSFLRETYWGLPLFKILQHSLSLLGLLLIFIFMAIYLLKTSPVSNKALNTTMKQKLLFWLAAIACSIIVTGLKLLFTPSKNIIGILVVAPISGLMLGIALISLTIKLNKSVK